MTEITPELLLEAYKIGVFPMAESRDDPRLFWVEPDWRGVIPLDGFHIPRRLKRTVRQQPFEVRVDTAFEAVMRACAERPSTWINSTILSLYTTLHASGHAHSVECWREGQLVGGLYGVSIGGAFFGESMFSRARDASKVALVYLVARLIRGGYRLLDAQFITEHLSQFGAIEMARDDYIVALREAITVEADYWALPEDASPEAVLQSISQTS